MTRLALILSTALAVASFADTAAADPMPDVTPLPAEMRRATTSAGASTAGTTAAESGARLYSALDASCGDRVLRIDLQINPGAEPNLRILWQAPDATPGGRDWQLPSEMLSGTPVMLDGVAGYPKARLEDLRDKAPRLQMTGYDGVPMQDCPAITLQPVAPPVAQYATLLDSIAWEGAVTPAVMADFLDAERRLPPADLLPPLDRAAFVRDVAAMRQRLAEALAAHVAAAPMTDAAEAAPLIRGLRALWTKDPGSPLAGEVLTWLRDTQQRHALLLLTEGAAANGLGDADGSDATTTCRILEIAGRPMMARDHVPISPDALLELASEEPLITWTRATADAQLAEARRCDSQAYADLVVREWPRIETRAAALTPLTAWAADRAALPATLEAYDATGWLTDAPVVPAAAGLSRQQVTELTNALRAPLIAGAAAALGAKLAQGVEMDDEPMTILSYCRLRMTATRAPAGSELAEAALAACETVTVGRLEEIARAIIARDLAAAEAAPATLDGALGSGGYKVAGEIASWPVSPAQEEMMADLRAAAADAQARMAVRRDAVVAAEITRLEAEVAALDPAKDDSEALPDCRAYDQPQPWLQPLRQRCRELRLRFSLRHGEIRCQRLFETAEAPDALRIGRIDLGGGDTVPVRTLLCDGGIPARLDRRGGLFSAPRHEVQLDIGRPEVPLTLSGTLQASADGTDLWTLADLNVSPGALAEGLDPDAPDTLRHCLAAPNRCTK